MEREYLMKQYVPSLANRCQDVGIFVSVVDASQENKTLLSSLQAIDSRENVGQCFPQV